MFFPPSLHECHGRMSSVCGPKCEGHAIFLYDLFNYFCVRAPVRGFTGSKLQTVQSWSCVSHASNPLSEVLCRAEDPNPNGHFLIVVLCPCAWRLYSASLLFSVTFHLRRGEKQASNFDNPSSNCKACDWISVITSMSGLLEKCQKVCSSAGSVKNLFVVVFFPPSPTFSGHWFNK